MYDFTSVLRRIIAEARRIAILGVGNEFMGDDGLGVEAVRRIKAAVGKVNRSVLILECGTTPESYTRQLVEFKPDLILVIDAVDFKGKPGSTILLEAHQLDRTSLSTHKPSFKVMRRYLEMLGLRFKMLVLGVQPGYVGFASNLTIEVDKTIDLIVRGMVKALT